MTLGKKITTLAAIAIVGYAVYAFIYGTGPSCSDVSHVQATEAISKDFLDYRMPRWTNDSTASGTQKPVLQFDMGSIQVTDVYLVSFTATGPESNKEYYAIYDCKLGRVEYSASKTN